MGYLDPDYVIVNSWIEQCLAYYRGDYGARWNRMWSLPLRDPAEKAFDDLWENDLERGQS